MEKWQLLHGGSIWNWYWMGSGNYLFIQYHLLDASYSFWLQFCLEINLQSNRVKNERMVKKLNLFLVWWCYHLSFLWLFSREYLLNLTRSRICGFLRGNYMWVNHCSLKLHKVALKDHVLDMLFTALFCWLFVFLLIELSLPYPCFNRKGGTSTST